MSQDYFYTKDGIALWCKYGYEKATPEKRKAIVNGCGPEGWKSRVIPDTMYGLYIGEACDIHDWGYEYGETIQDKQEQDRGFKNNLLRLIDARTTKNIFRNMLLALRYRRAQTYFTFVDNFGGPSFWDGKNKQKVV